MKMKTIWVQCASDEMIVTNIYLHCSWQEHPRYSITYTQQKQHGPSLFAAADTQISEVNQHGFHYTCHNAPLHKEPKNINLCIKREKVCGVHCGIQVRSDQVWEHAPEQHVAASTFQRYSRGLCLAIPQADAEPSPSSWDADGILEMVSIATTFICSNK